MKEKLSNFLPDLPGMIDLPGSHDNSSLRSLIEKPPILGGSFNPITGTMLAGFRLHTGPVRALLGSRGPGGRPEAFAVVFLLGLSLPNVLRRADDGSRAGDGKGGFRPLLTQPFLRSFSCRSSVV